jgi:FtsZ-interacting cell division protein ZipA
VPGPHLGELEALFGSDDDFHRHSEFTGKMSRLRASFSAAVERPCVFRLLPGA